MSRNRKALLVVGLVALAFLAGFGWQFVRAERLERELTQTRRELALLRAETAIAAAAASAQRGNEDMALKLASDFFTRLQAEIGNAPAEARAELEEILAQRDVAIAAVSRGGPEGRELLARLYARYRVAIGGPDNALPVAAEPPTGGL
ncbi:MAG: hypothetical protein DIU52_006490 [bacterium]|jgi:hypothetical protein|nr:MAG: hypothetical protein DIU52_13515 [bacterium]